MGFGKRGRNGISGMELEVLPRAEVFMKELKHEHGIFSE
jgi:hypothetical protein